MKYDLIGVDGNAFAVMGYTAKAMRREGFSEEEIDKMYDEAKSGDYGNLLVVCMEYVNKANEAHVRNVAQEHAKRDSQFKSGYALNPLDDLDDEEEDW